MKKQIKKKVGRPKTLINGNNSRNQTKNQTRNQTKNLGGRPRIVFSESQWKEFESLCALQCTKIEITEWFNVDDKTLENLLKKRYKRGFSEVFAQKRTKGLVSLRRRQFQLAETNPALAIFLGKNYLSQRDKTEIEHSGSLEERIRNMTEEDRLKRIAILKQKIK